MGERKVLNKYIPADFDPALVPRGTKLSKKDGTVPVRMMLPFSVQCDTCMTFLYRGRKFNSKKEPMGGADDGRYLGIQRWRFIIKCTHCSRPVTFLTDPKNADYEMESGGTRNYEVYKENAKTEESATTEQEEEEKIDPMKALENRVLDSQREMADLDNLEEIRAMNRRHAQLMSVSGEGFDADTKAVFKAREAKEAKEKKLAEAEYNEHGITFEEEEMVKSIKFGKPTASVHRLSEEDEKELEEKRKQELAMVEERQRELLSKTSAAASKHVVPMIKVKRKRPVKEESSKKPKPEATIVPPTEKSPIGGLAGLLGDYGSDSNSE
jgi:hypothetical protein